MSITATFTNSTQYGRTALQLFRQVSRPLPLQSDPADLSCTPFFILSAGRSGSTLLRALITQHPAVCIPPESHVLGHVTRKFKHWFRFLPWEYAVRMVVSEFQAKYPGFTFWELDVVEFYPRAFKLPAEQRTLARLIDLFYSYYVQQKKAGASRWGDKSMGNAMFLPEISQIFPQARYIHIIRDGRDVVASHVAADTIPDTNIRKASGYWIRSVTNARAFGARVGNEQYLEIFYEDLVRQPEPVTKRIYEFLNLDYTPEVFEYWKQVDALGDASREIHKNLRKPINANSIGKWRKQLNEEEQRVVQDRLRDKLLELNYAVE